MAYKRERHLQSPQDSSIRVGGRDVINFCANNYLGLANHPAIVEAAHEGLRKYGYGLASVRFICGTQDLHKQLEADDGELTRTSKVRRGHVGEKYASLVDALYGGKQMVHVEAQVRYEDGRTGTISADLKIRDAKTFPLAAARKAA